MLGGRRRSRRLHGGARRRRDTGRRAAPADAGVLTLDGVRDGRRVRIVSIRGGRRLTHRLAALGLVPGSVVTVSRSRGPAIVAVGGARIAVGRGAAAAIEVREAGE